MADLKVVESEAGDLYAGFDVDGTFVPFANVPSARIAQLQERAESLRELAKADDAASKARHDEAVASLPYDPSGKAKSSTSGSTKGGAS